MRQSTALATVTVTVTVTVNKPYQVKLSKDFQPWRLAVQFRRPSPSGCSRTAPGLFIGQPVDEERAQRLVPPLVHLAGGSEPPGPVPLR